MRLFVREFDDVYGFVYMLAPKDNMIHTKLIWLPPHLQDMDVCHYEVSFEPSERTDEMKARWLDGLPELLINLIGRDHGSKIELNPDQNVIRIEHSDDWEAQILIEMMKTRSQWQNDCETGEVFIDLATKVSKYVIAQAEK